jgi:hypothetical protein
MLLTEETTPEGEARIYATQMASVVTYFTDDGEGGTMLHAEPGEFACRWSTTQDKLDAVREAVLAETAVRLNCPVDKVLHRSLSDLSLIADPITIPVRHTWSRRKAGRRPGR